MEQNVQLFDKTFTLSKITAYSLSMEIDQKSISYAIVDHIRHKFVALIHRNFKTPASEETFLDIIDQQIKADQYLQKHYKEVNFIYPSDKFVLIPEEFFSKEHLKLYFQTGNQLDPGEEIQFNFIPEIKAYLSFAISSKITNFFVYRFPEINFYHQAIPMIKQYIKRSKQVQQTITAVNIRRQYSVDVLVVNQGSLLFYNILKCKTTSDALYKILRVIKDFDFNTRLELMGQISKQDQLVQMLSKYIADIDFAKPPSEYEIEFDKDVEIHRFANLLYIPE